MDVCLRVLKESNKSRFDSYSVRNSVLIISHITFWDCRVHIFSDNLSRNSYMRKMKDVTHPLHHLLPTRDTFTLSLPNVAKGKFRPNFHISFSNILTNKWHRVKVQAESFHLNGHIIGFRLQTEKLESPYKTPSSSLAVKRLRIKSVQLHFIRMSRPSVEVSAGKTFLFLSTSNNV